MEENDLLAGPREVPSRGADDKVLLEAPDENRPVGASDDEVDALLARCRGGDGGAFGELFDRYRDYVFSVAWYVTRNESLALDVVQEVFYKLLRRLDRLRVRSRFTTYLYRVTVNSAIDARRAERRLVSLEAVARDLEPVEPQQEERAVRQASAERLRRALLRLSPTLRAPLLLRYVAGLSYEEIARVLRRSVGTVSSRLHRAHRRLAEELGEE